MTHPVPNGEPEKNKSSTGIEGLVEFEMPRYINGLKVVYYPIIQLRRENEVDIPEHEIITIDNTDPPQRALLSSLNVIDRIHRSWYPLLVSKGLRINDRMKKAYTIAYKNGFTVRPNPEDVFNVFSMPLESIRAVIVGQDPYPGWDQASKRPKACGYSFATLSKETPPSLQRIRTAIANTFGTFTITNKEQPNNLRGWIDQGVFLLNNTPLVFLIGGSESETECDISPRMRSLLAYPSSVWQGITAAVCKEINTVNATCPFILMGREAHYLSRIVAKTVITSHPSTRSECDFDGKCFTEVPGINWTQF